MRLKSTIESRDGLPHIQVGLGVPNVRRVGTGVVESKSWRCGRRHGVVGLDDGNRTSPSFPLIPKDVDPHMFARNDILLAYHSIATTLHPSIRFFRGINQPQ